MEDKRTQRQGATTIRSLPHRATVVRLLGKLSLILGVAVLALPLLFALELIAGAHRVEQNAASKVIARTPLLSMAEGRYGSVGRSRSERSGIQATQVALPDNEPGLGPTWPMAAAIGHVLEDSSQGQMEVPLEGAPDEVEASSLPDTDLPKAAETPIEIAATAEETGTTPSMTILPVPAVQANSPDPEARPVQIRIPSIKVKRSIVELPQIQDPRTGTWSQDLEVLFRKGRKDLVGHYEQSSQPGQPGNTILAGHNYGRGTKGVFLKIGRLKRGKKILVINASGQTFTYRVESVQKLPWQSKDADELIQHAKLLAPSGNERLTLVTCGGGKVYPFPARIYVIAVPVRD